MLGLAASFDSHLLLQGFIARGFKGQLTAGLQHFCAQWRLANQALIDKQVGALGHCSELNLSPGGLQTDIYGLGFAQPLNIHFLLQRKIAVFGKLQLVSARANFADSAGYATHILIVN